MIAQHLINENGAKGLKPNAMARLGVPPWGRDTKNLLNDPLHEVLEYNFLDTFYTLKVKEQQVAELKQEPRLARVLTKLMMPASRDLVYIERRGIWFDVKRHA